MEIMSIIWLSGKNKDRKKKLGLNMGILSDNIKRLELELAFLSGKLNETSDEEEKEKLDERFLMVAKEP